MDEISIHMVYYGAAPSRVPQNFHFSHLALIVALIMIAEHLHDKYIRKYYYNTQQV